MKPGDPYNAYYQFKVREIRDAASNGEASAVNGSLSAAANKGQLGDISNSTSITLQESKGKELDDGGVGEESLTDGGVQIKGTKHLENLMDTPIITREPPPPFEFSDDPPTINAFDLDLIKLTAQFVAIHGRSFLTNLMAREQRNYQFDFLRPQHGMFTYFTQLIEQYSKILMPSKSFLTLLEKETTDIKSIIEKVRYRTEWTRILEAEKRREEEEAERERIQYAQIDWHDFVIVETVDYQLNETGNFPPPTTPEQVGSRLLLQQRLEANGDEGVVDAVMEDGEADKEEDKVSNKDNAYKNNDLSPLPPSLDNVLIRKDYNPKAKTTTASAASTKPLPENYVISPITGEKIPADKLAEHMRYSLLDPRWLEQRDRTVQEKMAQEEVYAAGSAIESSLKNLAERRTDIFGSGVEETSIGQKIGEDGEPMSTTSKEKVTWDGFSNTVEATTRAARANITVEDQLAHLAQVRGEDKEKIGPSIPSHSSSISSGASIMKPPQAPGPPLISSQPPPPVSQQSSMRQGQDIYYHQQQQHHHGHPSHHHHTQHQQQQHLAHHHHMAGMYGHVPPPMLGSHDGGSGLLPPPLLGGPVMQGGMMGVPPPSMAMSMGMSSMEVGHHQQSQQSMEPPAKKARTEESLKPEEEFLSSLGGVSNVQIKIQIPNSQEKPEWKLNGQMMVISVPYITTVASVKSKIQEMTNVPPQKQKLQFDGLFVKDNNTLAFYNMPQGATFVLGLKERGGRKK